MFATLEKLVEWLLKGIELYSARSRKARRKRFGVALLQSYLRLRDVIDNGNEIVASVKGVLSEPPPGRREWWQFYSWELRQRLSDQARCLDRLHSELLLLKHEMDLFAPDVASEIRAVIGPKGSALEGLADVLDSGIVPDEDEDWTKFPYPAPGGIAICRRWDAKSSRKLHAYLGSGSPESRLSLLERQAKKIRVFLTRSFDLNELLHLLDQVRERR